MPGAPPCSRPGRVLLHGHCQQKAVLGTSGTLAALKRVPGLEITEIDSGCCGMAGSFGYEHGHFEISARLANRVLIPSAQAGSRPLRLVAPQVLGCRISRSPRGLAGLTAAHTQWQDPGRRACEDGSSSASRRHEPDSALATQARTVAAIESSGVMNLAAPRRIASRGMPKTMQVASFWAIVSDPASRISSRPPAPSSPMPVMITPAACGPAAWAAERNSTSTLGRWRQTGGPSTSSTR